MHIFTRKLIIHMALVSPKLYSLWDNSIAFAVHNFRSQKYKTLSNLNKPISK